MLTVLDNYAHGYVAIPVIIACKGRGLFKILNLSQPLPFADLVAKMQANSGHLRATLQMLECLHWVCRNRKDEYLLTPESDINAKIPGDIKELMDFSFDEYVSPNPAKAGLGRWIGMSARRWDMDNSMWAGFLDGLLVIPLLLTLKKKNLLNDLDNRKELLADCNGEARAEITSFFINQGWAVQEEEGISFTDSGRYLMERIFVTATVASYKPMLDRISEVIFGDCQSVFTRGLSEEEMHVDRSLNVTGSGFQHEKYFLDVEEAVIDIFSHKPVDEQPKYIADMGCGDGTLLKKIYEIIKHKSMRGQVFDQYPVKLIGVDFNEKALIETARTLNGLDHLVLKGDIGDPERMITDLKNQGIPDVENILHIRSFLDHNRPYIPPADVAAASVRAIIPSEAVCVDRVGNAITPPMVIQSLVEHFKRWAKMIGGHGLLMLEAHCLDPKIVAKYVDKCESLYFDAVHRFSQQLLVEADQFLMAAAEAGLFPKRDFFRKYPKTLPFCRITLSYFERRDYIIRYMQASDLPELEHLEKRCWEPGLRTPLAVLQQRWRRYPQGQLVLERDNRIVGAVYSQRIGNVEELRTVSFENVDELHRQDGTMIQLLGVNILPEWQHQNLGDQLLEFMLQRCSLMSGIQSVSGVTRCKDYYRHNDLSLAEYIKLRNQQGRLVDNILRFHELHGALITGLISDYRAQDRKNNGHGVLVEYDLFNRRRNEISTQGKSQEKSVAIPADPVPDGVGDFIVKTIVAILGKNKEAEFSLDRPFMEMGLDSADLLELNEQICTKYPIQLEPAFFFKYSTARQMIAYLQTQVGFAATDDGKIYGSETHVLTEMREENKSFSLITHEVPPQKDIAIIGVGCRLPGGVRNKEQLWELLIRGQDATGKLPRHRMDWPENIDPQAQHQGIDRGGFLDDIAGFDAAFFRISPAEAELMDPQQRMLLEISWDCLEDGGYPYKLLSGSKTGIFIGASGSDYNHRLLERGPAEIEAHHEIGVSLSVLANRISYFYNFSGPSIQMDTACSSSLVAVHEAVKSLRAGECEQALAGGINIICHPYRSIAYYKAGMLAPDGRCKTFDKAADGFVRGEGAVLLLLKPLERALADRDSILAVIKGSAVNHGGQAGGLTVPNPEKQTALLIDAYRAAGVAPETVGYIEAHGTGTSLGDPLEINGLKDAFAALAKGTPGLPAPRCGLGSIKTNIGHLEAAAGVAGLLKVVLSMRHRIIPASLNFTELNPQINLAETPFYIVDRNQPWQLPEGRLLRRAGVSSFGSGGTNAHIVLEEMPAYDGKAGPDAACHIICLSAKTEEALRQKEEDLALWLVKEGRSFNLADISAALLFGREHFDLRAACVVGEIRELQVKLGELLEKGAADGYFRTNGGKKLKPVQSLLEEFGRSIPAELHAQQVNGAKYEDKLRILAELYTMGCNPDWQALPVANKRPAISMPTYPFAQTRYWMRDLVVDSHGSGLDGGSEGVSGGEQPKLMYLPVWEEQTVSVAGAPVTPEAVLLVYPKSAARFGELITGYYRRENHAPVIVQVELSSETKRISEYKWLCGVNDPEGLAVCLAGYTAIDCLYFLSEFNFAEQPDEIQLAQSQHQNELQLLRLVKLLKRKIPSGKSVDCYLITQDNYHIGDAGDRVINPRGGGITGLAYSVAQGEHQFLVRNIDISGEDLGDSAKQNALLKMIVSERPSASGEVMKLQNGRSYRQAFLRLADPPVGKRVGLKRGGVYVIAGGSGTVGQIITRYLLQEYDAKVIWIGRQPATANTVREKLADLSRSGETPLYLQADLTDLEQLKQAVGAIKQHYSAVNGAIFSGLVVSFENSVRETTEKEFLDIIRVKTEGSINFYLAFQHENLDFMCYFSSGQAFSFSGAANLAAYATGITFSDTFVRYLQAKANFPVGTINWGFWEPSVLRHDYRKSQIGWLEEREGFDCFERFTGLLQRGFLHQSLCLKVVPSLQKLMNYKNDLIAICDRNSGPLSGFTLHQLGTGTFPEENFGANQIRKTLEAWISKILFGQMRKLLFRQTGALQTGAGALKTAGILPKYALWLKECLEILVNYGYLRDEAGYIRVNEAHDLGPDDEAKVWADWNAVKAPLEEHPDWKARINLVDVCLRKLPEMLTGRLAATEVLFPNASMELVEGIYHHHGVADYFNMVLAEAVEAFIGQRLAADSQAKVRIIEAGAGTGGTSAVVFDRIKSYASDLEYCYTDISKSFLLFAAEKYGPDHPYLTYKTWNVELPVAQQGITAGAYDIVIATNVLHATRDIRQTLRNIKAALGRNGILLLNELTRKDLFTTLTFGLLDGWWLFTDPSLRISGSPLLKPEVWKTVLEEEGYRGISFPAAAALESGQQIIIAASDGLVRRSTTSDAGQKDQASMVRGQNETDGLGTDPARPVTQEQGAASRMTGSTGAGPDASRAAYVKTVALAQLAKVLRMPPENIDADEAFSNYGLDSILGSSLINRINEELGIELNRAILYDYTTVNLLTGFIVMTYREKLGVMAGACIHSVSERWNPPSPTGITENGGTADLPELNRELPDKTLPVKEAAGAGQSVAIAVVGMAGQFPDAPDVNSFWRQMAAGHEGVHELPREYLDQGRYYDPEKQAGKTYCKWGGVLAEKDCFDPKFFNISPREAESMNPHQRLILQESWKAVEDAGYNPKQLAGAPVGLFIGAEPANYFHESFTGSSDALIASRLSYYLNLNGPALVVNTGCSSSAVAIHLACESLRNAESSLAIAGGVYATLDPAILVNLSSIEMISPTGKCFTYDERADGTVLSEGVAVVVLKRLNEAIADGDHIYGVIAGSGMNQDGASNGITAPNGLAQERLIAGVYQKYGIHPEEITLVEVHGTGTKLGDPVEANALARAFKRFTSKQNYCAVGSAKSYIGHTGAAAGVISLIKVLLSLQHRRIPGMLNFRKLNSLIDFGESAFYINTELREWKPDNNQPLMAALNSFGHSGTNVHLVIREYPQGNKVIRATAKGPFLIPLSARNQTVLKEYAAKLKRFLTERIVGPDGEMGIEPESLAYTLQTGREAMEARLILLVQDVADLIAGLEGYLEGRNESDHQWIGRVKKGNNQIPLFSEDDDVQAIVARWASKGKLEKLGRSWVQGLAVNWELLYDARQKPQRMSLPVYPFAKERYPITEKIVPAEMLTDGRDSADVVAPLPQQIQSTFPSNAADLSGTLLFEPCWRKQYVECPSEAPENRQRLVILCEIDGVSKPDIETQLERTRCIVCSSSRGESAERFESYAVQLFTEIQNLLQGKLKGKGLIQVVVSRREGLPPSAGLSGILKTAGLENPNVAGQLIEVEPGEDLAGILAKLEENRLSPSDQEIRYQGGERYVAVWNEVAVSRQTVSIPWEDGGIYLITGGIGGLGLILAREIAQRASGVSVILAGRTLPGPEQQARLKELQSLGAGVVYRQVDVTRQEAVYSLIGAICKEYDGLTGIIHCAGVIKDNYIIKKTGEELRQVLAPKAAGLVNLDEASKDIPLKFLILFSSGAGALGNSGQADYSAANAFMDAYAGYRNALVTAGQRYGRTLSVNWPLWQAGGMQVDRETQKMMLQTTGMAAMATGAGILALYQALASGRDRVLVMSGRRFKIREYLAERSAPQGRVSSSTGTLQGADPGILKKKTLHQLKLFIKEVTRFGLSEIDPDEPLESYGIDSVMIMQLNRKFADVFGEISQTLLYEYKTLEELAEYFVADYPRQCREWTGMGEPVRPVKADPALSPSTGGDSRFSVLTSMEDRRRPAANIPAAGPEPRNREPIAIIGMSGRYPQAGNLDEYWENLKAGKDCITEIPEERWPLTGFYNPDPQEAVAQGQSYSKWGGFIAGFADFDPLFFNISPREAMNIDPQERVFIESCWAVLEDAGYTRERLAREYRKKVGVFAGITKTGFALYGPQLWEAGERALPNTSFSSVANRVSYLLDLEGPSLPVDTMCSSSLTAIHEACEHLYRNECEMAIAGGVNLYLHPSAYVLLCAQQMLSRDGRCKSFGSGGNGFVVGEGVGALLLKPLSRAIGAQDHIYAVIRGTGINHGGKTNGYTVPNPVAHSDLIRATLDQAGINARAVSYVEAHGTGTELGDPIEITGITQAFCGDTPETGYCAIGSVKSNIGHLEAAAGIAGVTKVVLQMKHRQLVPSLHAKATNPKINFTRTPFVVQQELTEWVRPQLALGGELEETPRIASVSSFGAGGSNAYLVLEEYLPKEEEERQIIGITPQNPALIVLSARDEAGLREQARRLLTEIEQQQYSDADLADMAYTLQTGREAMEERLATPVGSLGELEQKLRSFVKDRAEEFEDLYCGRIKRQQTGITGITADEVMQEAIEKWIWRRKYGKLLELWVMGGCIDWNKLYDGDKPRRISLPTYPFAKQKYWIADHLKKTHHSPQRHDTGGETFRWLIKKYRPSAAIAGLRQPEGTVVVMADSATEALTADIACRLHCETVCIKNGSGFSRDGNKLTLAYGNYPMGVRAAKEILQKDPSVRVIIDLSDLGVPREKVDSSDCLGKIGLIQEFIKAKKNNDISILHFTNGLQAWAPNSPAGPQGKTGTSNLAGSILAGLIRTLGAEYGKLRAATVDVEDIALSEPAKLADIISHELQTTDQTGEVCYRNETRYVPEMDDWSGAVDHHGPVISKHKAMVITGGTRGIGAQLALHYADKGHSRFAILGKEALPERDCWDAILDDPRAETGLKAKIRHFKALEAKGAQVMVYGGSLTDRESLELFFADVAAQLGAIGAVFHCAGWAAHDNPAFIYKTPVEIERTFEPKIDGLQVLSEVLERRSPEAFVLFSSVAAVSPRLGVGASIYAAANGFMDYFANYRLAQGKTYYRAIDWTNWLEGGMGVVNAPVYRGLGFSGHSSACGFELLEKVIQAKLPCSLPCFVNPDDFKLADLLSQTGDRTQKLPTADTPSQPASLALLKKLLADELQIAEGYLDEETPFHEFGVDSIILAQLVKSLEARIHKSVDPSIFLEYPTLKELSGYLGDTVAAGEPEKVVGASEAEVRPVTPKPPENEKIAVIGLGCIFPQSPNIDAYWHNLKSGKDLVRIVPKSRWDIDTLYSSELQEGRSISKWGSFLDDIEYFDPGYFTISKEDAVTIDPLIRKFLEVMAQTIHHAGYTREELWGQRVGVFVGARASNFAEKIMGFLRKNSPTGIGQNFISAYASQVFNFTGPNLVVDTACSSSLVSIHLACQSLMLGESDLAVAGGVDILLDEKAYLILSKSGALSPDGKCFTFDERANGFVPGEGSGAVLLKRLTQAIADQDTIYAVIDGTAVNNDGNTMGVTTPNPKAQMAVIEAALRKGNVNPATVSYVETHGTGTLIGDPIELKALTGIFRKYTAKKGYCGVGSIKSNMGHLLSAAGISGFIKVLLCIYHKKLVRTLHCEKPNPRFEFDTSPFFPVRDLMDWDGVDGVRRAGISAFGFGGTNAHILVSGYETGQTDEALRRRHPYPVPQFNKERYWFDQTGTGNQAQRRQLMLVKSL